MNGVLKILYRAPQTLQFLFRLLYLIERISFPIEQLPILVPQLLILCFEIHLLSLIHHELGLILLFNLLNIILDALLEQLVLIHLVSLDLADPGLELLDLGVL